MSNHATTHTMPLPPIYETHRVTPPKRFADLSVGDRYPLPSRTLGDGNFAAFQAVSLDNHPIHYDHEYCRALGHPGPLAHGLQVLCFTAAGAGLFPHEIGDALIGMVEVSARVLKPASRANAGHRRRLTASKSRAAGIWPLLRASRNRISAPVYSG